MPLTFIKRESGDKVDSREFADAIGVKHSDWFKRTLLANKAQIEFESNEVLELDSVKNKQGKPTKIAWLSVTQLLICINLCENTEKSMRLKSEYSRQFAYLLHQRKSPHNETPAMLQWQHRADRILVNRYNDRLKGDEPIFNEALFVGRFSPDQKLARFLAQLEQECGYVMPWKFPYDAKPYRTYPPKFRRHIMQYNRLTMEAESNDNMSLHHMWGDKNHLPWFNENICPADKVPAWGVAWIDEPPGLEELWKRFLNHAVGIVNVYNNPQKRAKYGLPSHEEVENDTYGDLGGKDSVFLTAILRVREEYDKLDDWYPKVKGFQAHKDWCDWMSSEDEIPSTMRKVYLGDFQPVYFATYKTKNRDYTFWNDEPEYKIEMHPDTKVLGYPTYTDTIDGFAQWEEGDHFSKSIPNPDAPLFDTVRIYDNKYEPLFDWYLENIWLPQHSLKFFQSTDPKSYPQLAMLLKDLPPSTALPKMFVQSVQRQLTASKS